MRDKEFKVGDKVRVIDTPCPAWMQNMPALPDTIFKVEGTQNGKLTLSVDCSDARFIVDAEHFELVEMPEQAKNMDDLSYEPISEAESYLVNQTFGNSYIRATSKCFDIKGEIKDYDPKTAFLHDLSELLRKYNAVINASWDEYFDNGYPKIDLDISFNGHVEGICFENVLDNSLTADNVLKYDK